MTGANERRCRGVLAVTLVVLLGAAGSFLLLPEVVASAVDGDAATADPPAHVPDAVACTDETCEGSSTNESVVTRRGWRDQDGKGSGSRVLIGQPVPLAAPAAPGPLPADPTAWARLAGGALFLVWIAARAFPLAAGSRLERHEVCAHPVRRRMLDHLQTHPGATTVMLAEVAGVGCGRALYHLAILEREQMVRARRLDRRRRFFPATGPRVEDAEVEQRDLARPERQTGRIVRILRVAPGTTLSELARRLGMSPGQTHYHVTKLDEVGVLYRVRRGRRVRHYLTAEGQELVARVMRLEAPQEVSAEVPPSPIPG